MFPRLIIPPCTGTYFFLKQLVLISLRRSSEQEAETLFWTVSCDIFFMPLSNLSHSSLSKPGRVVFLILWKPFWRVSVLFFWLWLTAVLCWPKHPQPPSHHHHHPALGPLQPALIQGWSHQGKASLPSGWIWQSLLILEMSKGLSQFIKEYSPPYPDSPYCPCQLACDKCVFAAMFVWFFTFTKENKRSKCILLS